MQGQTLVISGATKGIGRATAYRFAKEGVNIAFTYNSNEQIAEEMVEDLKKTTMLKPDVMRLIF
jgi:7-alpha-hydroxysteroid dehydrogenase